MKKITALLLVLVFAFALVACENESSTTSNTSGTAESSAAAESSVAVSGEIQESGEAQESSEAEESSESDISAAGEMTLEEFIEQVKATDEYKASVEQAAAGNMEYDVFAEGNSMIYKFTFTIEVPEGSKELLDAEMKNQASTFEASASTIRLAVPSLDKLIIAYYDINGELITSAEY